MSTDDSPWLKEFPSIHELRRHPELGVLAGIEVSLVILPDVLAGVYRHGGSQAARDQARSIAGIARVMRLQISAYRELVLLGRGSQ